MSVWFQIFQYTAFMLFARWFVFMALPHFLLYGPFYKKFENRRLMLEHPKNFNFLHDLNFTMQYVIALAAWQSLFRHPDIIGYTKIYTDVNQYGMLWFFLSLPICLMLQDTWFYWMHRFNHENKCLYNNFHSKHHKTVNITSWGTVAFHPVDAILINLWLPIELFLIPVHPDIMITHAFIGGIWASLGHTGFRLFPFSWNRFKIMQYLNTAPMHSLHHIKNGNYGLYFLFWDKAFGTHIPDVTEKITYVEEPVATQPEEDATSQKSA
jgi:lathosterol oxidase